MKKIFVFALCLILLVGCFNGCGTAAESETAETTEAPVTGLQVGFSRVDVTPTYSVHVAGTDTKNRESSGFRDPITISCIAFSMDGETFLVYTMDYLLTEDNYTVKAEEKITEATGIPADRIIMNCTHTHSGPAIAYSYDSSATYREQFNKAAVKAANAAIEDMAAAQVYGANADAESLVFVRHYEMENGTFAGANYGSFSGAIKGHAYEGDDQIQILRMTREGKKDVVLVSNPAHATFVGGTDLSADIAYSVRNHIEENANCHVAYFIGAAGDQVPTSRIDAENPAKTYLEYGQRMGDIVLDTLSTLEALPAESIRLTTQSYTGKTIKEGVDRLEDAKKVVEVINQYGNSANESKAAASQYGFSSVYQASAIVTRSKRSDTATMTLNILAFGDTAMVFAPYEMFSESGKYIKENSPYPMTFIVACSENHQGYMPTVNGFRVECYETHVTVYERGTAEILEKLYVELLTSTRAQ